jgi:hypothetical protein
MFRKWLVSRSTLEKRTTPTSKDLSWVFENAARCPHEPAFSVIFLSKILQTVGKFLAMERGGPSRSATVRIIAVMRK